MTYKKGIISVIFALLLVGCGTHKRFAPQNPHINNRQYGYSNPQQYQQQYQNANPLSAGYYPSMSRGGYQQQQGMARQAYNPYANRVTPQRAYNPYANRGVTKTRYNGAIITQHNRPHIVKSYVSAPDVSSRGFSRATRQAISPQARRFLAAINAIRAKGAVCAPPAPPLNYDNRLESAARSHTQDMSHHNFVNHTGSDGSNFLQRIGRYGYPARPGNILGEVLTFTKMSISNTNDMQISFERAMENFLQSPNHCRIIMNPRMRDVGVGYTQSAAGYYWVLEFGSGS